LTSSSSVFFPFPPSFDGRSFFGERRRSVRNRVPPEIRVDALDGKQLEPDRIPVLVHPISKRFRIALFSEGDVRIENGQSYAVSRGSDHAQPDKAKQRNQAVMLLEIFGRQMLGHFHAHQQRHGGETGARIEDCDLKESA